MLGTYFEYRKLSAIFQSKLLFQERNYNHPKRERILEWQAQQEFLICPTPDQPGTCNVYQELRFPGDIYDNIQEYHEEPVEAEEKQR